jgi:uncharacterized alpha-E superfamily protein
MAKGIVGQKKEETMLSRVANSIYWMCRYIERAENVARFISVNLNLLLDMPSEKGKHWEPLIMITGDQALFEKNARTVLMTRRRSSGF